VAALSQAIVIPGRVTVIMPHYNTRPEFLREAIDSIRRQTYPHWELIVVDDGSATPVDQYLDGIEEDYPEQLRCLTHPNRENRGISASRNLALSEARGEYVAFLDADDVWDATQLAEQVQLLREQPAAELVYGNTIYWHSWQAAVTPASDVLYKLNLEAPRLLQPPTLLVLTLQRRTFQPCMTSVLVRRTVFLNGIAFREEFRAHYEDQVFLAQVFAGHPVYLADACWGKYRQHTESVTGDGDSSTRALAWRRRYLEWLTQYLSTSGFEGSELWRAVERERWLHQHRYTDFALKALRLCRHKVKKGFRLVAGMPASP
jgi:glycosyltransferase involved in cell wall biosynthesis